ncbi:hypothetical protein A2U01_0002742 [Trifolium medium]|uniref:Uncharacterized protein n=1 Tax=Trifolium medium TaxID=97028 RepID=A0A392M5C2_9FABA|nr:hypothetical protein [Trifolium medium]
MVKGCLMPRLGKYEDLDDNDLMIIYHMLIVEGINLPCIIIRFMMEVASWNNCKFCVSYGMVLTLIFKHFGISFEDEIPDTFCKKFDLKNTKHFKPNLPPPQPMREFVRKRKRDSLRNTAQSVQNQQEESHESDQAVVNSESQPTSPANVHFEFDLNIPASDLQEPSSDHHMSDAIIVPELRTNLNAFNYMDPNSVFYQIPSQTTSFAPLFSSQSNNGLFPLFNESLSHGFFNPSALLNPFTSSLFTVSANMATSVAQTFSNMFEAGPSNAIPQTGPSQATASQGRSKVEKDVSKIRKGIKKLFEGQRILQSHLTYNTMEHSLIRMWLHNVLCHIYNLPTPNPHPFPVPGEPMPVPSPSSSSDASSDNIAP